MRLMMPESDWSFSIKVSCKALQQRKPYLNPIYCPEICNKIIQRAAASFLYSYQQTKV